MTFAWKMKCYELDINKVDQMKFISAKQKVL